MSFKERAAHFDEVLSKERIDITKLSQLCIEGIPDTPRRLRSRCWRLLLGYEPIEVSARKAALRKARKEYYQFVNDLLVDPFIEATRETQIVKKSGSVKVKKGKKLATPASVSADANPLMDDPKYTSYFADNATLEQIDKDVRRTLADIAFFQQPVPVSHLSPLSPHLHPKLSTDLNRPSIDMTLDAPALTTIATEQEQLEPIKTRRTIFARIRTLNKDFGSRDRSRRASVDAGRIMANRTSIDENDIEDLHWESIERILFVYAKLNPGLGYVQGMNELLAPLYFVLAHDDDPEFRAHSEADTFYCFVKLMSEARDLFERTHDHDESDDAGRGISAVLSRFMDRLKVLDPELHTAMLNQQIEPAYYAFRWYCCMMAQEFTLPDVIRLWDSILADRAQPDPAKAGYQTDFCCALLINVRSRLLEQSFADNIKMLQHYPTQDIGTILSLALDLGRRTAPKRSPFPSLSSLGTLLSRKENTEPEVIYSSSPRQSQDVPRPLTFHHVPPQHDDSQVPGRLSYDFQRPQFMTSWFRSPIIPSTQDSDEEEDMDEPERLPWKKPTSIFKRASHFIAQKK